MRRSLFMQSIRLACTVVQRLHNQVVSNALAPSCRLALLGRACSSERCAPLISFFQHFEYDIEKHELQHPDYSQYDYNGS